MINSCKIPAKEGYRYDGTLILCAPGADNLLCGLNAGSNVSGSENTLIGSFSGNSISTANSNSFTGAYMCS